MKYTLEQLKVASKKQRKVSRSLSFSSKPPKSAPLRKAFGQPSESPLPIDRTACCDGSGFVENFGQSLFDSYFVACENCK